ncbi:uncharacterized protein PSFLO_02092 [Pseudozyma flocculosa]|uniref:Uncharacterized protein n=1 Tax=Pseudozyma flocculosa TaxID=84751 RepID=A0A5C3F046_9BASI|nr:uncharacterized protein PSFLO_02092 [Pseudozyma flocculosa]
MASADEVGVRDTLDPQAVEISRDPTPEQPDIRLARARLEPMDGLSPNLGTIPMRRSENLAHASTAKSGRFVATTAGRWSSQGGAGVTVGNVPTPASGGAVAERLAMFLCRHQPRDTLQSSLLSVSSAGYHLTSLSFARRGVPRMPRVGGAGPNPPPWSREKGRLDFVCVTGLQVRPPLLLMFGTRTGTNRVEKKRPGGTTKSRRGGGQQRTDPDSAHQRPAERSSGPSVRRIRRCSTLASSPASVGPDRLPSGLPVDLEEKK